MKQLIKKIFIPVFVTTLSCFSPLQAQTIKGEINSENPSVSISQDQIKVNLNYSSKTDQDINFVTSKATIFENNNQVLEVEGVESSFPYAMVQIAEMDNQNDTPEVIFESFSGGAHCCIMALILTKQDNRWQSVEIGSFDGGTNGASDIDNDGIYEYLTVDNRFLYLFSSYAGSFAPPQIWRLEKGKVVDVTKQPQYRNWLKTELEKFNKDVMPDTGEVNGFWAGYIAWKALIGEEMTAWQSMLKKYDQTQTYCTKYDRDSNCVSKEEKFPSALLSFLQETDYLSQDAVNKIKNQGGF